jgi:hypothetical protein
MTALDLGCIRALTISEHLSLLSPENLCLTGSYVFEYFVSV